MNSNKDELQYEIDFLNSKLDSLGVYCEQLQDQLKAFWTGSYPESASLDEVILAQWGRKRIDAMSIKD